MYGALLDQFRFVVPRIVDPLAQQRVKGFRFARVVKYLQRGRRRRRLLRRLRAGGSA
ncbi:MAG: hypothetical protein ACRDZN_14710 [Acidimicrobiales bacterium]